LIKDILASRRLSEQVDYLLLTAMLVCMMDGIIMEYSLSAKKIDSDKIAKQWVAFLFQEAKDSQSQ
jgi:cell division protein FtsW (lipid II flippase)